jgi:hypothetical protein
MGRGAHGCVVGLYAAALLAAGAEAWAGDQNTPAPKPSRSRPPAKLFIARQRIDAQVTRVDPSRQTLTLRTSAGELRIEAPSAVQSSVKKGDRVILEIGILTSPRPASTEGATGGAPPARRGPGGEEADPAVVRQQFHAEVAGVDPEAGILTLKSVTVKKVAGTVKVELPSNVVAAFRPGELRPVELAVTPESVQASVATQPDGPRRAGLAALFFAILGKKR